MRTSDPLWTTEVVDTGRKCIDNPIIATFLTLGWFPLVASVLVLGLGDPSREFVIAQLLTASIVILGPYQAYKYDTDVLPGFFEDVTEIITETDHADAATIRSRGIRLFRKKHLPFVLVWTAMVVSVLPLNSTYFADQGIVQGEVTYLIYIGFLLDFGFFSGLGLFSVIVTTYSIREIASLQIQIEPLHPDGLGGLSAIGEFAIWTTLLISNGALAIPLALSMVTSTAGGLVVYSGVSLYILLILLSFVYPTAKVNRRAQQLRKEHLENYRDTIRTLERQLSEPTDERITNRELALQMEIDRARKEFQDFQNVRLYPLSVGILSRLITSLLLPILFILIEQLISRFV